MLSSKRRFYFQELVPEMSIHVNSPSTPPLNKKWKKVLFICEIIKRKQLDPKSFMTAFLTLKNSGLDYKKRLWSCKGIDSTMDLVKAIHNLVNSRNKGFTHWYEFILEEVSHNH